MGKLQGSRCYLSGAMEVSADNGVEWRQIFTPFLQSLGVTVFDPTDKPTDVVDENPERWKWLRETGQFDQLRKEIKVLRCVDLRMVDVSDFLIVNFDLKVRTCGTWEEISLANRQKKPVIFRIKQGKRQWPLWFFGQLPHEMVFGEWDEVKEYTYAVDRGSVPDLRRWMLFDFQKRTKMSDSKSNVRFVSVVEMIKAVSNSRELINCRISKRQLIEHLIALRVKQGMTQQDIADRFGCLQSYISKLENGKDDDIQLRDLEQYTEALGLRLLEE